MARLTAAQAIVEYLIAEGVPYVLGIFGHGNVQLGQALYERRDRIRYIGVRNEQGAVHAAAAYARFTGRPLAVTTSVGPGATNLVTGAAAARINRFPVLLLPGEVFAEGVGPVLQQLESNTDQTVNDALRPVSKYWSRLGRADQVRRKMREAFDAMLEPGEEGPATLCLPMDVQAEALDLDVAQLIAPRDRLSFRRVPDQAHLAEAREWIREAKRPLIVAGGGVLRSGAQGMLAKFAEQIGAPVVATQAGKGAMLFEHPLNAFACGATGTLCGNRLAARADLVIGIGTRYADFTTASETAFQARPRFININIAWFDVGKERAMKLWGDALASLEALSGALQAAGSRKADPGYLAEIERERKTWIEESDRWRKMDGKVLPQSAAIRIVNEHVSAKSIVISAAGSLPGDLIKLWRDKDPEGKGYLCEYGYSTMGFEIAAGFGAKLAEPDREVVVLVGDLSFLMASQELVTAVQEGVAYTVVVFDNHGGQSIRGLQKKSGFGDYAMELWRRDAKEFVPVDFVKLGEGMGCHAVAAKGADELSRALQKARELRDRPTVIHLEVDRDNLIGGYEGWWDVPQPAVDARGNPTEARKHYLAEKAKQIIR
jgi:3D-(3,5/4)-trihydroxycyclohexane-1,2-dione acylhydrolase (decyclizing)